MTLDILYLGDLRLGQTSLYRAQSLERLGHRLAKIDHRPMGRVRRLASWHNAFFNDEVVQTRTMVRALGRKFDLAWIDKSAGVRDSTLRVIRQGAEKLLHFTSDAPMGNYQQHEWRNFQRTAGLFDFHILTKRSQVLAVSALGAGKAIFSRFSYESSVHYRPPAPFEPTHDVVFLGMPHGHRAQLVAEIARRLPQVKIGIFGPGWGEAGSLADIPNITLGAGRFGDSYRETLWRARMALSLVTYWNTDETSRRLVEIAACGTPVLGERVPGQTAILRPDVEMLGFRTVDEAVQQIELGLREPERLERLSEAATARIIALRLSNDELVYDLIEKVVRR